MLGPWNQGASSKLRKTRSAYPLSAVTEHSGGSTPVANVASPRLRSRGKMEEYPAIPTRKSSLTLKTSEPAPHHGDTPNRGILPAVKDVSDTTGGTAEQNVTVTASHHVAPSWDLQTAIEQNVAPPLQREDSTHLDADMIRRATECRSAMSGDDSEMPDGPDVEGFLEENRWNHTRSTTPPILSRQQSHRTRRSQKGSTGTRHANQEAGRACVYSPSIYSRPASRDEGQAQPQAGLNAKVADWPLHDIGESGVGSNDRLISAQSDRDKPLPPTPSDTGATASSSSPTKKLVKKRRSIFRFLRPASRKAMRSFSSPMLLGKGAPRVSGELDGPFDERDTLTVQYELTDNPRHRRSVTATGVPQDRKPSLGNIERGPTTIGKGSSRRPSALNASPPSPPQSSPPQGRCPTLAEYQLNLSIAGDSRRRPSSISPSAISSAMNLANIAKLEEIREDDDPVLQPSRSSRKLSKANAMDEAGDTVMGRAMKRHIDEKALFRSESKRRESSVVAQPPPILSHPSFGGSSVPAVTEEEEDEAVAEGGQDIVPATPGGHLLNTRAPGRASPMHEQSPDHQTSGHQTSAQSSSHHKQSPVDYFPIEPTRVISTKVSDRTPVSPESVHSQRSPRIGTSLKSWTKFPSHTRPDRAASAGNLDNIITRDFAVDVEAAESQSNAASPKATSTHVASPKSAKSLIRSPSRAYHGFISYYTDLLTRAGFHGQNRRTSVAMSQGTLVHPELEMLAPVTGSEGHVPAYHHLIEIEQHIEQVAKNIHKPEPEPSGDLFRHDSFSKKDNPESPFRTNSFRFKQHVPAPDEIVEEEEQDPLGGDGAEDRAGNGTAVSLSKQYQALVPPIPASRQGSESSSTVGTSIRIRKFPSVTVLDDGRGHQGSLSLKPKVHERQASAGGLMRDSTTDLLHLLLAKEKEERDKLLGVSGSAVQVA